MSLIKVVSEINGEDIGTLSINWQLNYWYDVPAETHPDAHQDTVEYREVEKIDYVELIAFNKVGIDVSPTYKNDKRIREILEKDLIGLVKDKSIQELKED